MRAGECTIGIAYCCINHLIERLAPRCGSLLARRPRGSVLLRQQELYFSVERFSAERETPRKMKKNPS